MPVWFQMAQAALTVLTAIGVGLVAYGQWRTEKQRAALDLFDKRPTLFNILPGLTARDHESIELVNDTIEKLAARRPQVIRREGVFSRSKLAWKVANYSAPMMYRLTMLAEGCALSWNARNTLTCYLTARAALETLAVLLDFDEQLTKLVETEDIAGIDALVMNRSFSSRDADWLADEPRFAAANVLTVLNKLDGRSVPGIRAHYDRLSEVCHPNSFGHHQFFGRLDIDSCATEYHEDHADRIQDHRNHVIGGILGICLACDVFDRVEQRLEKIAAIQERQAG